MAQDEKRTQEAEEERAKYDLFLSRPDLYNEIYGGKSKELADEDALFDEDTIVPQSAEDVADILAMFRAQEAERRAE